MKLINQKEYPRRLWALAGFPGSGKSTLAAQMMAPMLVIDADHRFDEVAHLVSGDAYKPDDPVTNIDPLRLNSYLMAEMPEEAGRIATIVVDSWTEIIRPFIDSAVLANNAGQNANRAAAFVDKASAARLLQSTVSRWGTDVLWIYHLQDGRDNKAKEVTTTSIPKTEMARLLRSLNAKMTVVSDHDKRGVRVDWCRTGRDGFTLWDDEGYWVGIPERLESAMYDGGRRQGLRFKSVDEALGWAVENGRYPDASAAKAAYDDLKAANSPRTAGEMWDLWVVHNA